MLTVHQAMGQNDAPSGQPSTPALTSGGGTGRGDPQRVLHPRLGRHWHPCLGHQHLQQAGCWWRRGCGRRASTGMQCAAPARARAWPAYQPACHKLEHGRCAAEHAVRSTRLVGRRHGQLVQAAASSSLPTTTVQQPWRSTHLAGDIHGQLVQGVVDALLAPHLVWMAGGGAAIEGRGQERREAAGCSSNVEGRADGAKSCGTSRGSH